MADAKAPQHHSHPETWPLVAACPWDACSCRDNVSRLADPATAFPVLVLNPIDPAQRTAALDTLLDHLQPHEALGAYNALLDMAEHRA